MGGVTSAPNQCANFTGKEVASLIRPYLRGNTHGCHTRESMRCYSDGKVFELCTAVDAIRSYFALESEASSSAVTLAAIIPHFAVPGNVVHGL